MTSQEKITKLVDGYLDMLADSQADVNDAYESDVKDYYAALQRQQALTAGVQAAVQCLRQAEYMVMEEKEEK
jgi:hypothetical protein